MTPFDACVEPQRKRLTYEKSVLDLIKFVFDIKRLFMSLSDMSDWNFIDEIFVFSQCINTLILINFFIEKILCESSM